MNIRPAKTARIGLHWALILALSVRNFIPVGYMPDFSRQGDVLPSMTICGGSKASHLAGKTLSGKENAPAHKADNAPCPFSVNAAFSFTGVHGPVFPALIIYLVVSLTVIAYALRAKRIFSNASPRSPPIYS